MPREVGDVSAAVGANARLVRERKGLTLREVGSAISRPHTWVLSRESGSTIINVDDLSDLAIALGVSPCSLLP